ncbi:MAG: hypothetical protein ACRD3Q_00715 [Terriglobales bacterium]
MHNFRVIMCLSVLLTTAVAFAQLESQRNTHSQEAQATTVAYVYVAAGPGGANPNQIFAYSANANGTLTPISGSPFPDNVYTMAVNGKFLMGASNDSQDINAYKIGSDGSLTYSTFTDYAQYNNPGGQECGYAGNVRFDHTGSDLYVQEFQATACANDLIASFSVNQSDGSLTYLGNAVDGDFPGVFNPASITGDNVYAYSADNDNCMYYALYGFQRQSNGLLENFNEQYNQPAPPPGISGYVADLLAADQTNHLAVLEQPANPPGCSAGMFKVASYTVDANGNLNTTDTYKTMPTSRVKSAYDMRMAPSGELVAIGGQEGLQVFHFNGANSVTRYTGLLTKAPITQMFWDNQNHLYAISSDAGELFVFTITPTTHRNAKGSPYAISGAQDIIVQPLTKK